MSYATVKAWTTAIADAIRAKEGTSAQINHEDFPARIAALTGGNTIESLLQKTYPADLVLSGPWENVPIRIPNALFRSSDLESFEIKNASAAVTIEENAFNTSTKLKKVSIPTATSIGKNAFAYASPSSYTSGNRLELDLPEVTTIGESAFNACQNSVIDTSCFTKVQSIGANAFYQARTGNLIFPAVTWIGSKAFYQLRPCAELEQVHFPLLTSIPSSCFDGGTAYSMLRYCVSAIFESVTSIGSYAFRGSGLKQIDLGAVTSIDTYVFNNCSSIKIIIRTPDVVASLGANAITGTSGIYVPDDLVESYKTATNWSRFASSIHGLSELEE